MNSNKVYFLLIFSSVLASIFTGVVLTIPYKHVTLPSLAKVVDFFDNKDLTFVQEVMAQCQTTQIDRGSNWIKNQLCTGQQEVTVGQPAWTFNNSTGKWVGIKILNNWNTTGTLVVQSGLISAQFFTNDTVVFYDANFTKFSNPIDENWILQNNAITVAKAFQSLGIVISGNNANVTKTYSTALGNYIVKYIFREGLPLKHEVTLQTVTAGIYTTHQQWNVQIDSYVLPDGTSVDLGVLPDGTITVTNTTLAKFKNLHFNKSGSPLVFEFLSSAWTNFKSLTITKSGINFVIKFNYGTWTNGFQLDPDVSTINYSNAVAVNTDVSVATTCPASGLTKTTNLLQISVPASTLSDACYRSAQKFSLTSIPAGSTVTQTQWIINTTPSITNGRNCNWGRVSGDIAIDGAATIWTNIGAFVSTYLTNDATCTTWSTGTTLTLGATANSDVQANIGGSIQIGQKLNSETRDSLLHLTNTGALASTNIQLTVTFTPTVTQPITITLGTSGAPTGTYSITGCAPSPATIVDDGLSHNIVANASCTMTITVPTDGANTRYRLASAATSFTVLTCASGTCTAVTKTDYYELQNTYQATPLAQTTFDGGLTFAITGTVDATAGSTVCSIAPAAGAGATSCSGWANYNTAVSFPTNPTGAPANSRWQVSGTSSFTQTTGGNTNNVNYYKQWTNTLQITAIAQTTFDSGLSLAITGTFTGTAGSTICTITPTGGAATGSCSGYSDHNAVLTFGVSLSGAPLNSRWQNAANAASNTAAVTTGGNTFNTNYYKQWTNTWNFTPVLKTWDAALSGIPTGTYLGTAATNICTASPTSGSSTTANCSGYSDHNQAVSFPATVTGAPANTRWQSFNNGVNATAALTSGGTNYYERYYSQVTNTFVITPKAKSNWDSGLSLNLQGTYLTTASSTICTESPTSGSSASASCSGYSDYNSAVTFLSTLSGASANTRWQDHNNGDNATSALTTGGSSFYERYYNQLQETYQVTPVLPNTWDSALTFTLTGTFLGTAGSTILTISAASGAGATSGSAWADYNLAVTFPSSPSGSTGSLWTGSAPLSFTDTTGANTDNVNYNKAGQSSPSGGGGGGGGAVASISTNPLTSVALAISPTSLSLKAGESSRLSIPFSWQGTYWITITGVTAEVHPEWFTIVTVLPQKFYPQIGGQYGGIIDMAVSIPVNTTSSTYVIPFDFAATASGTNIIQSQGVTISVVSPLAPVLGNQNVSSVSLYLVVGVLAGLAVVGLVRSRSR